MRAETVGYFKIMINNFLYVIICMQVNSVDSFVSGLGLGKYVGTCLLSHVARL